MGGGRVSAEWAEKRDAREAGRQDAVKMRKEKADRDKARRMQDFADKAREPKKEGGVVEESIRRRVREADAKKEQTISDLNEKGKTMASIYHAGGSGARAAR